MTRKPLKELKVLTFILGILCMAGYIWNVFGNFFLLPNFKPACNSSNEIPDFNNILLKLLPVLICGLLYLLSIKLIDKRDHRWKYPLFISLWIQILFAIAVAISSAKTGSPIGIPIAVSIIFSIAFFIVIAGLPIYLLIRLRQYWVVNETKSYPDDLIGVRFLFNKNKTNWWLKLWNRLYVELSVIIITIIIAGIMGFFKLIMDFGDSMMKNTQPVRITLIAVNKDSKCTDLIGDTIILGQQVTGSYSSNSSADLHIDLIGNKGCGVANSKCEYQDSVWEITSLNVTVDSLNIKIIDKIDSEKVTTINKR